MHASPFIPTADAAPATASSFLLGTYPSVSVALGGNITVKPGETPTDVTSINVLTSSNFQGNLTADPISGLVRVTNAHPAGAYCVTVKAVSSSGAITTATFTLSVQQGTPYVPTFTDTADVGGGSFSVAIGDFNNDGHQDLAMASYFWNIVAIRLGNGQGDFNGTTSVSAEHPTSVAIGDFNNDGDQDLAIANNSSNTVSIRLGDGTGGFGNATSVGVGNDPWAVAIGDFDNDGKQDVAVANRNSGAVSIRLGDGHGGLIGTTNVDVGYYPSAVAIGDFNNDGDQDFAAADGGMVSICLGDGHGRCTSRTSMGVALWVE